MVLVVCSGLGGADPGARRACTTLEVAKWRPCGRRNQEPKPNPSTKLCLHSARSRRLIRRRMARNLLALRHGTRDRGKEDSTGFQVTVTGPGGFSSNRRGLSLTHTHALLHSDPSIQVPSFCGRDRWKTDKLTGEARGLEGHCRGVTHLSSLSIYCATPDARSMR